MNLYHYGYVHRCHPDAVLPTRHSNEAAGYDLCTIDSFELYPGDRYVARTGLIIQPPPGLHTEILLRSSLAYKHNIMLINGVGLIDRDFAGPGDELRIMLYRAPLREDAPPVQFQRGDRLAQLVFRTTAIVHLKELPEPPAGSERGGLGSTGA